MRTPKTRLVPNGAVALALLVLAAGCGPSAPAKTADPPAATAAADPPAHHGTMVDIPGRGTQAYLSLPAPEKGKKFPAIVLIQEWWGLDDWIKQDADRFAAQGYIAVAPDLYHGKATKDPAEAHELMRGLPADRALRDIDAVTDTVLGARSDIDMKHIGLIGWCMGGGYALDFAMEQGGLAALVVNYGHLVDDAAKIQKISAPLLGNFAGTDRGIPPAEVRAFEGKLKADGKEADVKIYEGAGHAFMNPNAKTYDAAAAKDAWQRIDTFFAKKLKAG